MKKILFFFSAASAFYFPLKLSAQSDSVTKYEKNIFITEPIINIGKVVKNYPVFPKITTATISEISFSWQTMGIRNWHHYYNFPRVGGSVLFGVMGNDSVLGNDFALMPHIAFDIRKNFEMRIGCGFAYFPLIFDAQTNPSNTLIGAHINTCASFSLLYQAKLSKHLMLQLGAASFHSSNGHYQLPNIGINMLMSTIGIKYFPSSIPLKPVRKHFEKIKQPTRINIRLGAGLHEFGNETGPVGGPKYNVYAGSLYLSKRFGHLSNVHVGITGKYYSNFYEYIRDSSVYDSHRHLKSSAFSVFLGHEFVCGKISLLTQGGINFYNPFYRYYHPSPDYIIDIGETWLNSRLGFQYYLFEPTAEQRFNMFAGIFINANLGRADFSELSLGFVF